MRGIIDVPFHGRTHHPLQACAPGVGDSRPRPGHAWDVLDQSVVAHRTKRARSIVRWFHSKVDLMKSPNLRRTTSELGVLLRHWRDVRGKSQLDLSLDTGVSQKQISFVESGRSAPSRSTLTAIAQALDIPLRDRNTLLLAAGYAPIYSEGAWNAPEMQSVTSALERMLRQHEPFPAMVMDRYWNVLMTNESAPRFFNCFIDMAARESPRNMLHLMFDPKGMRPFVANWEDVAKGLVARVYRESVGRVLDQK